MVSDYMEFGSIVSVRVITPGRARSYFDIANDRQMPTLDGAHNTRMDRNSFGRLFTANSYNRNSGIRLRVSDTKSRLETSKDRHFR